MNNLKQCIQDDMKTALKARDQMRLGTIRLLIAAIQQREIDERCELDDQQVLATVSKLIKQRQDSVKQFQDAGRKDLADKETAEISVLQDYLPPPLTEAEIETFIQDAIKTTSASSMKDMGKVMGVLKTNLQGRADMSVVSAKIKALLQ